MIKKGWLYFAVTTDIRINEAAESYVSLTLHHMDSHFCLCNWTLEVTAIPDRHRGKAIADVLPLNFVPWVSTQVNWVRNDAANAGLACATIDVYHLSCSANSLHPVIAGTSVAAAQTAPT